jgi:hypothetical protein
MRQICRIIMITTVCVFSGAIFQQAVLHSQLQDLVHADSLRRPLLFSIGAGGQHGFIFAHSPEVENTKGARPTGAELMISWQRNDRKTWDLCNCYPRKGLMLAYYNFGRQVLGKGAAAAFFLEPVYRINSATFLSFKGSAGFAYLSNPFDSLYNVTNQSYSTDFSGYLLVGGGAWFRLGRHWWTNITVNYQHTSNGGFRQPNKGINWPTAGLSIHYYIRPDKYFQGQRSTEKFWKGKSIRWDAAIFGIAKKERDINGKNQRFPLMGLSLQGSKQVGRIHALTGGLEVFTDRSVRMRLNRDSLEGSATRAGVLVGHEFLLGQFIFSQRLGAYVYHNTPYFTRLYHRWGIHYYINKQVGLGFHLNAHKHVAEFVDFRISYSWRK